MTKELEIRGAIPKEAGQAARSDACLLEHMKGILLFSLSISCQIGNKRGVGSKGARGIMVRNALSNSM